MKSCESFMLILCTGLVTGLSQLSQSDGPTTSASLKPLPVDNSWHQEVQHPSIVSLALKTEFAKISTISASRINKADVMNYDGEEGKLLGSVLRQLIGKEFAGCSLVLAIDPVYLTSPVFSLLITLPHPKQIIVVREAMDLLKVLWRGTLCQAYLFMIHHAHLLSFADTHHRSWDYNAKFVFVGISIEEFEALTQTQKGKKTQHMVAIVKVLTFEFPPAVIYKQVAGKEPFRYGRDVEVVRALAATCNFTINFIEVPADELWGEHQPNGSWTGIIGMLGRGAGDIGIANIFISNMLGRRDHQHFTSPFHQSVNCVILKVPPPEPRWKAPSWPFRQDTWLALLLSLLLLAPVLYGLAQFSSRSNLIAFLTVTRKSQAIDTFKELYGSGLNIVGLGKHFGDLMKLSENIYLKELHARFIPIMSDPIQWVKDGRAGYISSFHYAKYTVTQLNNELRQPIYRLMKECTWPFSVAVSIQSNSPLKQRADQLVERIVESGLVHYWFQESIRIATQGRGGDGGNIGRYDGSNQVSLNINHMQGAFYILGLSYILAFLLITAEHLLCNRKDSYESTIAKGGY
ncbi:hypothetical protein Pmani_018105 [Petrolisthes manimaculis]|uniref:Ionotropic glutamate receptor L-glutamate and glycine-binding domain-containing protein n=1 Tax=Petrolisthes manimaculis TaxID=1843537 RepID=A0AAE1PM07_9EUCA|nr:hypothetical protein Pmani_018105 [Petrolisthes manimaculis]